MYRPIRRTPVLVTLWVCLLFVALSYGFNSTANGDDPNYTFAMGSTTAFVGGKGSVDAQLVNDGDAITAFQWGVCHDQELLDIAEEDISEIDAGDLDTSFSALTVYNEGWTTGILMNVMSGAVLETGTYTMYTCVYHVEPDASVDDQGTDVELDWCDTLGEPLIEALVVVQGDEILPTREDGNIFVTEPPAAFEYALSDTQLNFDPTNGLARSLARSTISIKEIPEILESYPSDTQGFQCAIRYDDDLILAVDMEPVGVLAESNNETGPGFFGVNTTPADGPGITVGVVYNIVGSTLIQYEDEEDVIDVIFDTVADKLLDEQEQTLINLQWSEDLGNPVLSNDIVVDGVSFDAVTTDGVLTLHPQESAIFLRGDCNDDTATDLADAIWILSELFIAGPLAPCKLACDVNNDEAYDQSDAVFMLNYRFLQGPEPSAPFPDCGSVDDEPLSCDRVNNCH